MTRPNRTITTQPASDDIAYHSSVQAAAAPPVERVVLSFDESTFYLTYDTFGPVNQVILGTAKDDAGETGYTYIFQFNNADYAFSAPFLIVDGSAMQGSDFSGTDPFFGDAAIISTRSVTAYNAHITTGGGNDSVTSGIGSDMIWTGAGMDYASIGTGVDAVYMGSGDDYIESTNADFDARDLIYGGAGTDEISFYSQDVSDADFVNVRSIEWLGLSQNGALELGKEAMRVGVSRLFVDDSQHAITVTADFTRTLNVGNSNFNGGVSIDASASSATILWHAEYNYATTAPTLIGGTGGEDTIFVTSGFSGLPPYGGDLTNMSGFEHIQVLTGTGDAGALVILDTKANEIDARFLDVDASTLSGPDPLTFKAGGATADIHILAGTGGDLVTTGAGDDRIDGGLGGDTLAGRGGQDVFVYTHVADSARGDIDMLTDFRSGRNTIDVTGLGFDEAALKGQEISFFGNVGEGGDTRFAASAGNGMLDAVYHTDTHTLWFDTDDSGTLDAGDLHLVLARPSSLDAADVLAGQMIV